MEWIINDQWDKKDWEEKPREAMDEVACKPSFHLSPSYTVDEVTSNQDWKTETHIELKENTSFSFRL